MTKHKTSEQHTLRVQAETLLKVLTTLSPREEWIVRWRLGFSDRYKQKGVVTVEDVATLFKITPEDVFRSEHSAIKKLRAPPRAASLSAAGIDPRTLFGSGTDRTTERKRFQSLGRVVASIKALSPELVAHLRAHHDDISVIPHDVFEHLVLRPGSFERFYGNSSFS